MGADRPQDAQRQTFLDHLDALRVLRADDDAAKSRILDEIGADGTMDRRLMLELARRTPVRRLDEFEKAHRNLMMAIEVLDRNGARDISAPAALGRLRPVLALPVHLVTRWIVKNHVNQVAKATRLLYERREANAVRGSPEHLLLRQARKHMTRVENGLRSDRFTLPTFLIGGAFLTGAFSATLSGVLAAARNLSLLAALAIVSIVLLGFLSWVSIFAAGVARHRIGLTTDWAVMALYRALGAAGKPPRDHSYNLALAAIALLLAAILVLPLATWLFLSRP